MHAPSTSLFLLLSLVACQPKVDPEDTGATSGGRFEVSPTEIAFPVLFLGQSASEELAVTNVGDVTFNLAAAVASGEADGWSTSMDDPTPAPGAASTLTVTLVPTTWGRHDMVLEVSDAGGGQVETVTVTASVQQDADGDGYGSAESGGGDCNDANASVHPDATDAWYDGVDQDCSGGSDFDQDGDGVDVSTDCDDKDPTSYPGATEIWYDGVDQDCEGDDDDDQDGDGFELARDCDDTDPGINMDAAEIWYDGIDQDCSGGSDSDQDGDSWDVELDCDDTDAAVNPDATEAWYDGVDQDCSGGSDYDADADGVAVPDDCDDTAATVFPGATETWYDGIDQDCAGDDDLDADADGWMGAPAGGPDCDDANAAVHPEATETWYDGVDQDCSGGSDLDQDGDGADYTTDCDDTNAAAYPGASETWYDGVDQDCLADDDYDQDADGVLWPDDCDDTNASILPGAADAWYDGIDADCSGGSDWDADGDGSDAPTDCNDADPTVHPGVTETWYDGVDVDCSGGSDWDADGDGVDHPTDCDDTNAEVWPGAPETWYDGVDADCAGDGDYDADGDGVPWPEDCNDLDPTSTFGGTEVWDGNDNDCDGFIDEMGVADLAAGVVYGASSLPIGATGTTSIGGDVTDSGQEDVIVGSTASYGVVWVVDGEDMVGAAGVVGGYASADYVGESYYYYVGYVYGPQRDVTGDGTADLLTVGEVAYSYYSYGWLFEGPVTGGDVGDAEASYGGDSYSDYPRSIGSGDIDGDGTMEIALGSWGDNYVSSGWGGTDYQAGNLCIFDGRVSSDYDIGDADDEIVGENDYDYLGYSLAVADWTGDGYADILVGATGVDSGASAGGAVYLVPGNASLSWSTRVDDASTFYVLGTTASAALGTDPQVDPGDLDGDGTLDVVFTSRTAGKTWLLYNDGALSGALRDTSADATFSGTAGAFGSSIAADTDFDGDGATDLWIGASGDDTAGTDAGAVWFFSGASLWSGTITSANADGVLYGASAGDALGASLAGGGDADGDGRGDLLLGASGHDGGASNAGAVYLVLGR